MPYNITKLNRDLRVIGDIKERILYKKTFIDSYSKLKTKVIKIIGFIRSHVSYSTQLEVST